MFWEIKCKLKNVSFQKTSKSNECIKRVKIKLFNYLSSNI